MHVPTPTEREQVSKDFYIVQYWQRNQLSEKKNEKPKKNRIDTDRPNSMTAVIRMFILFNFCSLTNVYLID